MQISTWIIWQFASYSVGTWLVFVAIAFFTARYLPWWCIPIGHIVIGAVIYYLDFRWILSEMRKPSWDGTPDMDIVFHYGVYIRIFLINTVLLPATILGRWWRKRRLRNAGVIRT